MKRKSIYPEHDSSVLEDYTNDNLPELIRKTNKQLEELKAKEKKIDEELGIE